MFISLAAVLKHILKAAVVYYAQWKRLLNDGFFFCRHPADDYGMKCVSSVYDLNQSPNMDVSILEVNVFKTFRCNAIGQNVADNIDQDTDAQYRKLPYQIACLYAIKPCKERQMYAIFHQRDYRSCRDNGNYKRLAYLVCRLKKHR